MTWLRRMRREGEGARRPEVLRFPQELAFAVASSRQASSVNLDCPALAKKPANQSQLAQSAPKAPPQ